MMLKSNFLTHLEFDHWANHRFLLFLKENKIEDEKVYSIFGHIPSSLVLWLKRIVEIKEEAYPLWKVYSTDEIEEMITTGYSLWKEFLEAHADDEFQEIISYTNTKGISFETPLKEIIEHIYFHGVYHRGQLAVLIRKSGFTPPYTDYIAFVRNQ